VKVLLDVGVSPRLRQPLQQRLGDVAVESADFHNWRSLRDDELLAAAERGGFTTLVTADKRMAVEQPNPPIAIIAVDNNSLAGLLAAVSAIADAIRTTLPGESCLVPVARVRR
jgi:predicted nuclease of predicted toxin-antitoxin system